MEKEIATQLAARVIEPAQIEWDSPVFMAPKKDGTMRFCVDFRHLNTATIPDTFPLPCMQDFIDNLGDASVFTTLYAIWVY